MNIVSSVIVFLVCSNFAFAAINLVLLPDEVRRLLGKVLKNCEKESITSSHRNLNFRP